MGLSFHRLNAALNSSQEWSGKGLGWLKIRDGSKSGMKREGFGLPMLRKNRVRVSERLKTNHEKGFGCFMVPKRWVGMVWEGQI